MVYRGVGVTHRPPSSTLVAPERGDVCVSRQRGSIGYIKLY